MKKYLLIIILSITSGYSQNNYINDDGTLTDYGKRKFIVDTFKELQTEDVQYDFEDEYFIIITKYDCGTKIFEPKEIQEKALLNCFGQLLKTINSLKKSGLSLFSEMAFEGIIFKTNTICMTKTRRYHFKFTLEELNKMPEYMDFEELIKYVVIENENKNIIYKKNEK